MPAKSTFQEFSSPRAMTACYLLILFALLSRVSILHAQDENSFFVPIVLSSAGANETHFTTELTLTNRSSSSVSLEYSYTAAFGGGSGQAPDSIAAGQQRIIPDTIAYLKSLGVPIPGSGNRGGTLWVRMHGLPSPLQFGVTARTTTNTPGGRAGLAYHGVRPSEALTDPAYLFGLRQNGSDRSNLALQNMSSDSQSELTLRVTVYSGDIPFQQTFPDVTLPPGGWFQFSGILHSNGLSLSNGYARVERIQGDAPYYAYAVINDQLNSDGSFILPVKGTTLPAQNPWTLPVVVGTSLFSSELVVTNLSPIDTTIHLSDKQSRFLIAHLASGQQLIIPNLVDYLREQGIPNAGSPGEPFVSALSAMGCMNGDCNHLTGNVFFGIRTFKEKEGRRYGMFYNGVPWGSTLASEVGLYGLQQNDGNRTNLAIVNTGEASPDADTFRVELYDGNSGGVVKVLDGITAGALEWQQVGGILASSGASQGYAHVVKTGGSNPFIAYAVRNDGSQPGTGSGDGDFIASSKWIYQPNLTINMELGGCGSTWSLRLADAPPNMAVRLVGNSMVPDGFVLPEGAKTDSQGNFTATGQNNGFYGNYFLSIVLGEIRSNVVSLHIPSWDECSGD